VEWVVHHFDDMSETALRSQMRAIFDSWSEEFQAADASARTVGEQI
jgi:hypothetical protein